MENTYHSEIKGLQTRCRSGCYGHYNRYLYVFWLTLLEGFGSISATYIGFIVFSA